MSARSRSHRVAPATVVAVVAAVLVRPELWRVAIRQLLRLAEPGWWRRSPFAPIPSADYLHFRLVTAYGGDGSDIPPRSGAADVVAYLRWCRTVDSHAVSRASTW